MSTINYLPLRSTITYQANGSTAPAGQIYTTLSNGQQVWDSVISPKVVTLSDNSVVTSVSPVLDYSTFGQTWTNVSALSTSASWKSIAMSATGQYQVATGATNIGVFYSSNYGQTWASATGILPNNNMKGITMSASGQYACVCVSSGSTGNGIWYSANYGASWTLSNAAVRTWASISMSATGQYVSAVANTVLTKVYISSDYGQTFNAATTTLPVGMTSISVSATGQNQYVASTNTTNTGIYYSTNFGSTWTLASLRSMVLLLGVPTYTAITTAVAFTSISCSASSQYVTACTASASGTPGVYVSTNYGLTFTLVNNTPLSAANMTAVAVNASGQYQVTVSNASGVYYSTDFGVTWTIASSNALTRSNTWTGIALSQSAQYVTAIADQGAFSTVTPYPVFTTTSLTASGTVTSENLAAVNNFTTPVTTYPDGSAAITAAAPLDYLTFGQNFTIMSAFAYGGAYYGAAMSATGQYRTITSTSTGIIYCSNNFGQTWTTISEYRNYGQVRMSATGQYQLTGVGSASSNLYVSGNYGVSWTAVSSPTNQWYCYAVSASGQYQYAAGNATKVYVSSNYGATWTITTSATAVWSNLACSASGQFIIGCINAVSGYLYTSNNYGLTWTVSGTTSGYWTAVACSGTGQYLSACITGGGIYYSTNYGATWTLSSAITGPWQDITCSASGQYQLACTNTGGRVYYSLNYGASWTSSGTSTGAWQRVCMSSTGQYAMAVGYGTYMYSSTTISAPFSSNLITTTDITITGQVNKTVAILARGNSNSSLTIGSGSPMILPWNAADSMSQGTTGITYDSGYFTNTSGRTIVIMITYTVGFSTSSTGLRAAYIGFNGTASYGMTQVNAVSDNITYLTGSAIITLANSGVIYISALQTSGTNLTITTGSTVQLALL